MALFVTKLGLGAHSRMFPSSRLKSEESFGVVPSLRPYLLAYWDMRNTPPVSLALTNIHSDPDMTSATGWATTGASFSVSGGEGVLLASVQFGKALLSAVPTIAGHVYYVMASVKATSNAVKLGMSGVSGKTHSGSGNYELLSIVLTAAGTNSYFGIFDERASGWSNVYIKKCVFIDITAHFLAGNELTATEMDTILAANFANSWFNGTQNAVINPSSQIFLPDTSGNGQHLKYRGFNYTASSGPQTTLPYYLRMDGTDDYCRRALASAVASGSACTIAARFRTSDVTAVRRIMFGDNMSDQGLQMYLTGTNLVARVHDGTTPQTATIAVTGNNNKWLTCIASYDPATKKATVWLNGVGAQLTAALTNHMVAITNILICNNSALTGYTPGDIGEAALFNKTFTDADALAFHNYKANWFSQAVS